MRKSATLALSVAVLTLAACSEKTQESAEQTVEAAGEDLARTASGAASDSAAAVKDAATQGAAAINDAANNAAREAARVTGRMGEKIQEGAAKVEAETQGESVEKAKRD